MDMQDQSAIDRELVKREALGHATDDEAATLRLPDNLDAWHEQLTELTRLTQQEQGAKRAKVQEARAQGRDAYWAAMSEHAAWNNRANYFRRAVEARLRECKDLIRERNVARSVTEKTDLLGRMERVEEIVERLLHEASL